MNEMDTIEHWGGVSNEEIQKCLTCKRAKCNNCLSVVKRGRKTVAVKQIDPETGQVIAVFDSIKEASCKTGVNATYIGGCVSKRDRKKAGGYVWKRA